MQYLIVNGDDFGASRGINRGIIELHERGVLTSTSLMIAMPAAADAVRLARHAPALGIGLHVTLTDEETVQLVDFDDAVGPGALASLGKGAIGRGELEKRHLARAECDARVLAQIGRDAEAVRHVDDVADADPFCKLCRHRVERAGKRLLERHVPVILVVVVVGAPSVDRDRRVIERAAFAIARLQARQIDERLE